jgi:WD40 repeat protein
MTKYIWIDTKERLRERRTITEFLPRRTTVRSVDAPLGEGCKQRELIGHTHNVPSISMSACGQWLASCSIDGTVRVWRLYDGQCIMQRRFGSAW